MLAVLVAGCGASTDDDTFAYDADAPLALETGAQLADARPLDAREISFASHEASGSSWVRSPRVVRWRSR